MIVARIYVGILFYDVLLRLMNEKVNDHFYDHTNHCNTAVRTATSYFPTLDCRGHRRQLYQYINSFTNIQ